MHQIKMFKLVVLSAVVALAWGAPQELPRLDGRIVGGQPADIRYYPYQLSLQYYGSHICGATIVARNVAITAAHCTDGSSASSLSVRAGSSYHGSDGQVVGVRRIHQHSSYNKNTIDYDISVLELNGNINLGSEAQPVSLPRRGQDPSAGTSAICTGWGTTWEGGSIPSQLQAVILPLVSRSICKNSYGSSAITDRMICAGFTSGGKDACQGDSGGPLVADGQLIGVVSWGYGCARPNYPGVYAHVGNNNLRDYISNAVGL